jgi:hypothetical protein
VALAIILEVPVERRTDRHAVVPSQHDLVPAAFKLEHVTPLIGWDDLNQKCIAWHHASQEIAGFLLCWNLSPRCWLDKDGSKNPTYQTGLTIHGIAECFRGGLNCLPMRALFNVPG